MTPSVAYAGSDAGIMFLPSSDPLWGNSAFTSVQLVSFNN